MFRLGRAVAVLVVAGVVAGLLFWLRPRPTQEAPLILGPLVEALRAEASSQTMRIAAYGTVRPREELKLVAQVRGPVETIDPLFQAGQRVSAGRALATIDVVTYQLEVDRLAVQVQQAQAEIRRLERESDNLRASLGIAAQDMALTAKELERFKALAQRQVVAESTRDKAEQRFLDSRDRQQRLLNQQALLGPMRQEAVAQRQMAEVLLKRAQLDLERATVRAPYEAWVVERRIEVGQYVNVGQALGAVYRHDALDVEVQLPLKDLQWLPADPSATPVAARVFAGEAPADDFWPGRVARIEARMDERTRTVPLVIELDAGLQAATGRGPLIPRPGMFVSVEIEGLAREGIFVLPRHTLQSADSVYLYRENRLHIQPVTVLRLFKDEAFITEGLQRGDLVISSPLPNAHEGMSLRLKAGT